MSDQLTLRLCRWCGRLSVPERTAHGGAYVCGTCRKRGGTEQLAPPRPHAAVHAAHTAPSR
ncbi:hypothetical protein DVA86_25830 [Streptomyces armeniacus]|uniref:Uncharacterized protein n=1 Tax=Streptomyces armeniacus TaxID=83291 RepID=A0A345XV88_9ACTN|nr:hypothetical protein [Streptomyces armeniacus]AXK35554.1 hypothetical protein DVA86_25830 [Streptomyces armeniacus]